MLQISTICGVKPTFYKNDVLSSHKRNLTFLYTVVVMYNHGL